MKTEATKTDCYFVELRTEGGIRENFRFDFKPTIGDIYSAMKVTLHDQPDKQNEYAILTQILVLIQAANFKELVEDATDYGDWNLIWVGDTRVGKYAINKQPFWNTNVRNWRPEPVAVPLPSPAPPPVCDCGDVDAFGGSDF